MGGEIASSNVGKSSVEGLENGSGRGGGDTTDDDRLRGAEETTRSLEDAESGRETVRPTASIKTWTSAGGLKVGSGSGGEKIDDWVGRGVSSAKIQSTPIEHSCSLKVCSWTYRHPRPRL